jgi:hypothetical protein
MHANADVLQAHSFSQSPTEENCETSGIKFAKFIPHHLIVEEIEKHKNLGVYNHGWEK